MNGDTHYWAFLDMLYALAVGNMKTLDLLIPHKTEQVTHIYPTFRPATDMLIGLWRKDGSVLDYAVPRAKKFVSGKRPQWDRATVGLYQLAACLWNEKLFRQLPMPNHKIFSKEYAIWRNTQKVQPKLFAEYPEQRINQVLTNPELEMPEQN